MFSEINALFETKERNLSWEFSWIYELGCFCCRFYLGGGKSYFPGNLNLLAE